MSRIINSVSELREDDKQKRDSFLVDYQAIGEEMKINGNKELRLKSKQAMSDYYASLPRVLFGVCPFCQIPTYGTIDPWGLDGLWWQEKYSFGYEPIESCSHFAVLTGALNLNNFPPTGGKSESYPGPDVPYIIPRLLDMEGVMATIGSFELANGYTSYLIVYYSQNPIPESDLTQTWGHRSFNFEDEDGDCGFSYDTSIWDFDIFPWIQRKKVVWNIQDTTHHIRFGVAITKQYPYIEIQGVRLPKVMTNDNMHTLPLPEGEVINPFSE